MTLPKLWAVLTLVGAAATLSAQAPAPASDPASWLGLTPPEAFAQRGAPSEVFPLSVDAQRWQVVHFYPDHSYLFWNQNHVWQVRLDKLWAGPLGPFAPAVAMGAARADVEAALGVPQARGDGWSVWPLPHQGFPRKLRLVFTDGVLTDAYLYRSDL